jgi:negative regulator of flagellin synthesis FlgM
MEIENNRIASLVTQTSGQGTPVEKQGQGNTNSPAGESSAKQAGADRIVLTGEARQLQKLEAQLASEPVVHSQRVEAVRSAVENGTFTIDPQRIAEKMMSLEEALMDTR